MMIKAKDGEKIMFEMSKNDVNTIFNSLDELSKKIKRLLSDKKEIEYLHNKQNKFFNEENLNYNTLKNFLLISKKNN